MQNSLITNHPRSCPLRNCLLSAIGTVALALAAALPVKAQLVYSAGGGGRFGTINVTNGAYTAIGTGYTTYNGTNTILSGLADAADGNLYGLDYSARLFQINRNTAALTLVNTVSGLTNISPDLAFGNTANGTLYMLNAPNTSAGPDIYSINPATAAATLLGSAGSTYFDGGIGGDGSGNLFATGGGGGSQTFELSTTSGAATQLNADSGASSVYALGYTNSNLYAFGSTGAIYTINTTTGIATNTHVTYNLNATGSTQGVAPLVFSPVPEPGTIALLALGGAGLAAVGLARRGRRQFHSSLPSGLDTSRRRVGLPRQFFQLVEEPRALAGE